MKISRLHSLAPSTGRGRFVYLGLLGLTFLLFTACAPPDGDANSNAAAGGDAGSPPDVRAEIWPAGQSPVGLDPDIEAKVDEVLASMTVQQKVGQVIQSEIRHTTPEDVKTYHLGSVLNGGGSHPGGDKHATPEDWLALADAYWDAAADTSDGAPAIPILWGVDAVHGHNNVIGATLFPHNVGLGATRDADLLREIGAATAREVAVTGLDWDFAPTLAVVRDDRWGRTYEGYSEDPAVVAELGAAYIEGVQGAVGDDFLGQGHILATAKHYLGDGGTQEGIDQGDNLASEEDLRDIHGAGYVTALQAGAQTVMASFSGWHGKKMHGNEGLLTDVLKTQMGFDGFVVGDWNGHGQVAGCTNGNCAQALIAGVDMFMVPEDWKELIENTIAQVESGQIPMERLDDAVRRILRVKHRFGLFDSERRAIRPSERPLAGKTELIGAAEHRAVARRAVRESLVLLKNSDGILPLDPSKKILVAGTTADDLGQQAGGWTITWQGTGNQNADFPGATSIWKGFEEAIKAGGGKATYSADGSFKSRPDVAVVVFGEGPYAEMQGDRLTMQYSPEDDSDIELLRKLQADGIPTVSVFLTGRPMWVNPHLNASDAFVVAWLPGTEGAGVADVLVANADGTPRHEFRGKLPYSWPKSVLQAVINQHPAVHEKDGGEPLFAFGFGLGYGDDGALAELSEEVELKAGPQPARNFFVSGPVPPWQVKAEGVDVKPVDRTVQEDARAATWPGDAEGSVALHSDQSFDLRREANAELSLAFDVKVETAPTAPVHLSVDSAPGQYPTEGDGSFDVTELLPAAGGDWKTVRIALNCFGFAGANLQEVHAAWKISTNGDLALRFAEVKLVSKADGDAPCPQMPSTEEGN